MSKNIESSSNLTFETINSDQITTPQIIRGSLPSSLAKWMKLINKSNDSEYYLKKLLLNKPGTEIPYLLEACVIDVNDPMFKKNVRINISSFNINWGKPGEILYIKPNTQVFHDFPSLMSDIPLPYMFCSEEKRFPWFKSSSLKVIEATYGLFLGHSGSRSDLHKDSQNNVLAHIHGEKMFVLISPEEGDRLSYNQKLQLSKCNSLDSLKLLPWFKDCTIYASILKPGDRLFIPKNWYHYAVNLSLSLSIASWRTNQDQSESQKSVTNSNTKKRMEGDIIDQNMKTDSNSVITTNTNTNSNIPFLNYNVFSEVISHMSADDLGALSQVSKQFNSICTSNELWKSFVIKHWTISQTSSGNTKEGTIDTNWKDYYKNISNTFIKISNITFKELSKTISDLLEFDGLTVNSQNISLLICTLFKRGMINTHQQSEALLQYRYKVSQGKTIYTDYIRLMDFSNITILIAMRRLVSSIRLPGEAPMIDAIVEALAREYASQNNIQNSADIDSIYIFCFSLVMLSTDLHSTHVKQKMSKEHFKKNNKGISLTYLSDEENDRLVGNMFDELRSTELLHNGFDQREMSGTLYFQDKVAPVPVYGVCKNCVLLLYDSMREDECIKKIVLDVNSVRIQRNDKEDKIIISMISTANSSHEEYIYSLHSPIMSETTLWFHAIYWQLYVATN